MNISHDEFNPYYLPYIQLAANQDIVLGLKKNVISVVDFYQNIPSEKLEHAYAEGKWTSIGKANGSPVSVRAIGYIITGHENHHNNVIRERYL